MSKRVWIEVYRDTIEKHNKDWNVTDILVTRDFAEQYFNECVKDEFDGTFEEFLSEYTLDETMNFYSYAMNNNAIIEICHME